MKLDNVNDINNLLKRIVEETDDGQMHPDTARIMVNACGKILRGECSKIEYQRFINMKKGIPFFGDAINEDNEPAG